MPKYVDPEARRRLVVDALFRVVVREGLQRASLRTVADEAALNIGSLRHYFASQQDLMRFAMRSMLDRVGARLLARIERTGGLEGRPRADQLALAEGLLAELLPLDEQRRAEVTVFLDFNTAARTNPALGDLSRQAAEGTRSLVRRVLDRLDASGVLRPGLDLDVESERLTALLDGLGLGGVLQPSLVEPRTCTEVLRAHLEGLAGREGTETGGEGK
ncbi:TetR family transcriptional regulator C-terminal domain-containing protein [Streptomyces sp. NPDC127114]|uniref:TetR family transcriptional regulator C-terminal domain-containing protein n=1 Tax=Streptomyces sp. NPDC127114 TaxID=3345366 RepID=UPI00363E0CE6